jgi:capsular exopolysaccharide synthesis family protein
LAELQRDKQVKENIYSSILIKYNEAKISDAAIITDAYIIDRAEPPRSYSGGLLDKMIYLLGLVLGLFMAVGLFVAIDYFDKSVKEADTVQKVLHVPVLTTIPLIGESKELPDETDLQKKLDAKLITSDYAPNIAGESFRLLRTKILMNDEEKHHSLIVASLNPGEGKSLVSSNLAITFAQQKIPTVLIDCDLRRGVLHNSFTCDKKPGLSDLLAGTAKIEIDGISKVIQKTHVPYLFILSSGSQIPNPSELLGSNRMREIYSELKREFGAIILDTPPLDFIPDAMVLNNFIHRMILVVRYGKTNLNKLSQKIQEFNQVRQDLLGVVINASSEVLPKKYYSYSYYQY